MYSENSLAHRLSMMAGTIPTRQILNPQRAFMSCCCCFCGRRDSIKNWLSREESASSTANLSQAELLSWELPIKFNAPFYQLPISIEFYLHLNVMLAGIPLSSIGTFGRNTHSRSMLERMNLSTMGDVNKKRSKS